jgi:hypothetical protein
MENGLIENAPGIHATLGQYRAFSVPSPVKSAGVSWATAPCPIATGSLQGRTDL